MVEGYKQGVPEKCGFWGKQEPHYSKNRTKRGPLYFDQISSILVQKLAIFLKKPHYAGEFGQFSAFFKPH